MRLWTDHSLHYPSPCATHGGGGERGTEDEGVKLTLEKREVREGIGLIFLCFTLSNSLFTDNKLK